MSDDNPHHDAKALKPRPIKTLGKEELFDVFKTDGEAEFFAKPAPKKKGTETGARTGPSIDHRMTDSEGPSISRNAIADADTDGPTITHQMNDASGPIIRNAEFNDASGPTIAHQMSDGTGPIIKNAEITDANGPTIAHQINDATGPIIRNAEFSDASGPTIAHQMSDGTGPVIKKSEIVDADGPTISHEMNDATGPIIKNADITDANGPTIAHQMNDATGPIIKRTLENTRAKAPTLNNPLSSITKTEVAGLGQPKTDAQSGQAHRMDTFSVHMAERIAQMKSAQKETMAKMDELEASTNEMQSKPTAKDKK